MDKAQLREMMKKTQKERQSTRIEHPLARYNNLGQLICQVCKTQVKAESLWIAHLASKQHKESVENLKQAAVSQTKRPREESSASNETMETKKSKAEILAEVEREEELSAMEMVRTEALKNLPGKLATTSHTQPVEVIAKAPVKIAQKTEKAGTLPEDFFDDGVNKPATNETAPSKSQTETKSSTTADNLSTEWEKFKEGLEIELASNKIDMSSVDNDNQEAEIFEIQAKQEDQEQEKTQQLIKTQLEELRKKQLELKKLKQEKTSQQKMESPAKDKHDDASEDDLEDLLDWRVKKRL
mmetsp:Transcript_29934/g.42075  ORF Transcript_29934/g.42075 Transcript_29934/m.42075 type:complete len:298 (-) Transcript_29934:103-996(-)